MVEEWCGGGVVVTCTPPSIDSPPPHDADLTLEQCGQAGSMRRGQGGEASR